MTGTSASMALPGRNGSKRRNRADSARPNPPAHAQGGGAVAGLGIRARMTMLFAVLVLAMLLAIIGALAYAALPALEKFGLGFFFTNVWNPVKASSARSPRSTERW